MTDVNDFYEPGDDYEPEPPDAEQAPLDLSAIADAYHKALSEDLSGVPEHCRQVLAAVSDLLAWADALQEELAYWQGLPVEHRYIEQADRTLRQTVHLGPLEELSSEPPF